ncbi:hypothetical protein [Thaumasiovibrio sp. DFM-14]|uniref:hypothetical protein n=1 Tax=Thaumasiovibrio sp. DFM-14 TaxID=3384792 RepID=UPI0039A3F229
MKNYFGFAILLVSFLSSAVQASTGEIKRIYPQGELVKFQPKDDSCNAAYNYYYFDTSSTQGKSTYSLLLSSAVARQAVSVWFEGGEQPCDPNVDKRIMYIYADY